MSVKIRSSGNISPSGQNLIRILISSYFIAASLGLISGTDGAALAAAMLPEPIAHTVGTLTVFGLSFLVLTGMWLRPAALLLALTIFWSSYITNFGVGGNMVVGDFWRDLALIGALFLTYTETGPRISARRAMLRYRASARRIIPKGTVRPRRIKSNHDPLRPKITPLAPRIAARDAQPEETLTEIENIFADYDEIAVA